MPNYDIIPLATDLLEYTIQRVRAKEPEYRRVQVYVMENGQLVKSSSMKRSRMTASRISQSHRRFICAP